MRRGSARARETFHPTQIVLSVKRSGEVGNDKPALNFLETTHLTMMYFKKYVAGFSF